MWLCVFVVELETKAGFTEGRSENTEREKKKSEIFQSSESVSHTGQRHRGVCVCVCGCESQDKLQTH